MLLVKLVNLINKKKTSSNKCSNLLTLKLGLLQNWIQCVNCGFFVIICEILVVNDNFNFSELLTIPTGSLSVAWNVFHKSHRPLLWCFMVLFHPFWTLKKIQLLFAVILISEWTIPWNAIMLIYKIIMLKHWSHWDIGRLMV